MVLRHSFKLTFLLLFLLTVCPVGAADEKPGAVDVAPVATFPGLSEMGERSTQLTDFAEKADDRLLLLGEVKELADRLQEWDAKIQEMRQTVATLGGPEEWYADRLIYYNNQFGMVRKELQDVRKELSNRQQEIEKIRARHQEEHAFWSAWGAALKAQGVKVPKTTVKSITEQLAQLEENVDAASDSLLPLQEQVGSLERGVIEELDLFSQALIRLRQATFRKNANSFASSEFYAQFSPGLLAELTEGVRAALVLDTSVIQRNALVSLLFLFVLVLLSRGIQQYRSRFEGTEEWQFVLTHPWAAGSFVAAVSFGNLFPVQTAVVKLILMLVGVTGATVLAVALIQNRRQTRILVLAAIFLLVTTALRLVSLPQPLFRVYVALLALIAIPLLIQQTLLAKKVPRGKRNPFFIALMRIGVVVLVLSLGGQFAGYVNFSSWLLQAAFETGMVLLFVRMGLRLGNGGIDYLIKHEKLSGRKFFKKYNQEVAERLGLFLKMLVGLYALLTLLPVWRIFDSLGDAWAYLANYGVDLGDVRVTLQMVGFAVVSLYLAMQISWLLQALCETQVFYRKSVDRGVRDAIKKLIHYGVVLAGFLVALSVLGMSLQNFVVILGALGVGIGFGLQDIVNNFLSGIIMLFERPIKVGDGILVDGEYGTVKYIGLRSTIVETLDQSELIVPNAQMISQKVTNWTLSNRRVRIVVSVGVAYGSDVPLVMTILADTAADHADVLAEPPPSPIFIAFGESSLDFELRAWVADIDSRPRVKSELLQAIDSRFREAGVEIPFPQRDLHLRSVDGEIVDGLKPT